MEYKDLIRFQKAIKKRDFDIAKKLCLKYMKFPVLTKCDENLVSMRDVLWCIGFILIKDIGTSTIIREMVEYGWVQDIRPVKKLIIGWSGVLKIYDWLAKIE